MGEKIGYVGVDHHHRDPYFAIASGLNLDITAVCEPGREIDLANLAAMDERPDEITTESQNVADLVRDATVYADPERLVEEADVDVVWITYRNDETPSIVEAAVENGVHVISEKPIGRTAADLEPVARKAHDQGVTVSPTTFYRKNPITMDLRERIREGFFGDVWTVEGRFNASPLAYRNTSHYIYDEATSRGERASWPVRRCRTRRGGCPSPARSGSSPCDTYRASRLRSRTVAQRLRRRHTRPRRGSER